MDGECAVIYLKDESCLTKTRVLGVPNEVLLGQERSHTCGLGDYKDDKQLLVLVAGEIHSNAALLETNEPRFFSVLYLLHFLNEVGQNVNWKRHVCETFMQNLEIYCAGEDAKRIMKDDSWCENLKKKFRRIYGQKD